MENSLTRKVVIYFFSGTGNSKAVAKWIVQEANERKIPAEIIDLGKLNNRKSIDPPAEGTMIGFISPTHGFNFAPTMFHFIVRFPKSKRNKIFIVNTRAGLKMGKIFIPGLSGMAQYLTAIILKLKGYKIKGMHPIDLPSNWISLHPGVKQKVVNSMFVKYKAETYEFAKKMFDGKKDLRAWRDIIQDLLITPIGIGYYFAGRFFIAKTFVASHDCSDCGLCLKQCPVQAIKRIDKRPFWTYNCESCMHCMNACPERAIETAHGFITAVFFIVYYVLLRLLYHYISPTKILTGLIPEWGISLTIFIFETAILVFSTFGAYRAMHYLLRFRWFERIIVYTSFTKFKFWRRYKPPKHIS